MRHKTLQITRLLRVVWLAALLVVFPCLAVSQFTTPQIQFIIGPQLPVGNSWFDATEVERGKIHGKAFPAEPPTPLTDEYIFGNYYDLGLGLDQRLHSLPLR